VGIAPSDVLGFMVAELLAALVMIGISLSSKQKS
jgi:hypothetical protein